VPGDDVGQRDAVLLLEPGAVAGQVVEQPAGLVLLGLEAGEPEELVAVLAGLGDAGLHP
jgi:hypothetical protein